MRRSGYVIGTLLMVTALTIALETNRAPALKTVAISMNQTEQAVDEITHAGVLSAFGRLPLHFIANQGQVAIPWRTSPSDLLLPVLETLIPRVSP